MSLLWADGFENYGDVGTQTPANVMGRYYTLSVASSYLDIIEGRISGSALDCNYSDSILQFKYENFDNSSNNQMIIGFATKFYTIYSNVNRPLLSIFDQADNYCYSLWQCSNATFGVGNSAVSLDYIHTETELFQAGEWVYIEIKWDIGASQTVTVRVNGTQIFSQTGLDTRYDASSSYPSAIGFYTQEDNGYYDDLYIVENDSSGLTDFLGPIRVSTIRPSSDTATVNWSPSTGIDHYALVDESEADDDTTYVYTSNPSTYDLYEYSNPTYIGDIEAIVIKTESRDDASTGPGIYNVVVSDTTTSDGSPQTVTSADYLGYSRVVEQDPDTTSDWTESGLNAAKFGNKHA